MGRETIPISGHQGDISQLLVFALLIERLPELLEHLICWGKLEVWSLRTNYLLGTNLEQKGSERYQKLPCLVPATFIRTIKQEVTCRRKTPIRGTHRIIHIQPEVFLFPQQEFVFAIFEIGREPYICRFQVGQHVTIGRVQLRNPDKRAKVLYLLSMR